MAKRKGTMPSTASLATPPSVGGETGVPSDSRRDERSLERSPPEPSGLPFAATPSPRVRRLVTVVLVAHWGAVLIALSANLAPSYLHSEIQPWLAPLQVTTGQDYVMLPLELTHAARMDSPLVIEVQTAGEADWRRIPLPMVQQESRQPTGLANTDPTPLHMSRSRWPNLGRLMAWIALEEPGSDVLPEFLMQSLKYAAPRNDWGEVSQVRLFQPHLLSFDEMLMVNRGQAALISDDLQGDILYSASVVRGPRGQLGLVPQQEPARTSKPLRQPGTASESAGDEPR